ncbi:MAG: hypothetical protein GWN84_25855 [Gammaproteobacteria bacterium]|nr:hypothetical protein [Gammaproteobacteria bacterium]NIR84423.1 hypothetical protein [Gammaproteobacteria bacterium]NIR90904.1 hypothetical protein [Gammaproteobacteria bacterium]NIU07090.1 hypothetical protein [Gammaproteobacteria bacterium]NIV76219.1 hypothetical protein [Gammaproteobacteria bacterium]
MNYFKRWTAGIFSRIDGFIAQVENHDALAAQALRELAQSTARAHVQLKRVRADGEALRRQLAEQREHGQVWKERAKRSTEDEGRAIECLRRSKRAARSADELERRLAEHERMEQQLGDDIRKLEERIRRLREQRNLMRTRQSRAEAMSALQDGTVQLNDDIHEMFERWEIRVTEAEYTGGVSAADEDRFEREYVSEEEETALKEELRALRRDDDV